ncbi:MAG TPA: hypothetical protein VJW94_07490 [Candidatus Acidoferrum sp.]|nr:hypothetical protein [Candidatus Acidoferrum sp.]
MTANNRRAVEIQEKLWDEATTAAASNPQVVPTGLFIEALNDTIDGYAKRLAAARNSVPSVIFLALEGIAMIAVGFSGYGARWGGVYSRWSMWVMSAVIAGVITLVIDLNTPQAGLITVSQQPLLDLLKTMK